MRQFGFLVLIVIMGVAWGAEFSMLKLALQGGYDEITVLTVSLGLIAIAYFVVLVVRGKVFWVTWDTVVFLIITALMGYLIPLLAVLYAAPHLPVGIMTLIASLSPVVTVSTALLLRTELVSARRVAAIALGTLAALLVLAPEASLPGFGTLPWMLLVCLVPLSYGVESIYVAARWPRRLDAWQVSFGEALMAFLLILPVCVIFGDTAYDGFTWSIAETGIVLFVVAGLINIVLYFYIIQHTGGVLVSFGSFVSLFAGIAWGMVLFSESHGIMVWIAVAVLILALVVVAMDSADKQRKKD